MQTCDDFSFDEFKRKPIFGKKHVCKKCLKTFNYFQNDPDALVKVSSKRVFDIKTKIISCPYCDNVLPE